MSKKNQHVVPTPDGKWGIKGEGNSKLTKKVDKKNDAVNFARQIAQNQNSELIVHNRDGKISDKDSSGNDPCPPKDKN